MSWHGHGFRWKLAAAQRAQQHAPYASAALRARGGRARRGLGFVMLAAFGGVWSSHAIAQSERESSALDGRPAAPSATRAPSAPDFALRSFAGPNVRLSEHRGDVVVLSFWSSRCNTCRQQLALLEGLYGTYRPAGFTVLGVSVDDDITAARSFAASQKLSFPMLLDAAKSVARAYRVAELPMTVAIDRFGAVRFVQQGGRAGAGQDLGAQLRQLIDE